MKKPTRYFLGALALVTSLLLIGAGTVNYTEYLPNLDVATNAVFHGNVTIGGVAHNTWPSGSGGGNVTNSGASVVGMFPAYTDTTGTLVTPTNALPVNTTIQSQTLTTVLTNKVEKAGDTMTGALTINQGAATGLTVTNSASRVALAVQGFSGQTSNLVTVASGGTNLVTVNQIGQTLVANGTAAAPAYSFLSSTNTGLYWNGTFVYLYTVGAVALAISSAGSTIYAPLVCNDTVKVNNNALLNGESAGVLQLGADAASPVAQTFKAHDGSGTDKAGANLTIEAGQSTGTGTPGDLIFSTSLYTNTTGSAANAYTKRAQYVARPFTVTNTTASAFQKFTMATNTYAGVKLFCTVFIRDASNDIQSKSSTVVVDAVNKTGTITATVSSVDNTTATSSGTLTVAYTVTDEGSNVFRVDCAATSSLTPTVAQIKWVVEAINSNGTITVTPQTN